MYVVIQVEQSKSFVWVGGSKDGSLLVNPTGVVVIIPKRVDTFSAHVPFSALIDRCERVQSWIDRHQPASAGSWSVSWLPRLDNLPAIGAEDVSRVLAHGPRWDLTWHSGAAPSSAGSLFFGLPLPASAEPEE